MFAYPVITVSHLALAVLAIVAGVQFLALKAWARGVLEALSWLAIALLVVMGLSMIFGWAFMGAGQMEGWGHMTGGGHMGGFFMLLIAAIYAAPFVVMLVYLRSPEVKGAMQNPS